MNSQSGSRHAHIVSWLIPGFAILALSVFLSVSYAIGYFLGATKNMVLLSLATLGMVIVFRGRNLLDLKGRKKEWAFKRGIPYLVLDSCQYSTFFLIPVVLCYGAYLLF